MADAQNALPQHKSRSGGAMAHRLRAVLLGCLLVAGCTIQPVASGDLTTDDPTDPVQAGEQDPGAAAADQEPGAATGDPEPGAAADNPGAAADNPGRRATPPSKRSPANI